MASVVLVADGSATRAERVLEACRGAGLALRGVGSGPDALEAALAEPPQLVVAALDLPLIDGLRLAEILRANPRTAEARFLFLGRPSERPPSPFDETLPGQTPAQEIAARVVAMLDRQQRMDAVRRESLARRELGGQLGQVAVADLVQLLHTGRRTGVVELAQASAQGEHETGSLWLEEGELVHATVGAQVSGRKALFRMLGWREGRFSFSAERRAPAQTLSVPTRILLVEGVRQVEALARDTSLPPREAEIRLAVPKSEIPHAVHPVTQEVLLLLEMYGRVHDIVEHCSHPDYQVLRTVQTLIERGLVSITRGEAAWPATRAGSRTGSSRAARPGSRRAAPSCCWLRRTSRPRATSSSSWLPCRASGSRRVWRSGPSARRTSASSRSCGSPRVRASRSCTCRSRSPSRRPGRRLHTARSACC